MSSKKDNKNNQKKDDWKCNPKVTMRLKESIEDTEKWFRMVENKDKDVPKEDEWKPNKKIVLHFSAHGGYKPNNKIKHKVRCKKVKKKKDK